MQRRLPDYTVLPEEKLSFDPLDLRKSDTHPLRGLEKFGPYSGSFSPSPILSPLRIGLVTVEGFGPRMRDYLSSLSVSHQSKAKAKYFPDFPGFTKLFSIDLSVPRTRSDPVVFIAESTLREALSSSEPERLVMQEVSRAINTLALRRGEFDVLVFYFPSFLQPVFRTRSETSEFDLHDATKAATASLGIPSQIILDRSIDYPDRASVLWSLAIALYAKGGGTPWKLGTAVPGTAYVGLSYVLKRSANQDGVVTCCSQVFDDQGHGLQFLLYTAESFVVKQRNPFLSKSDMRRLIGKSVELYVRQNGTAPRRVVVHKTTQFTRDERLGAAEALGDLPAYDLLQVQEDSAWMAVKGKEKKATPYPVDRGTILPISKYAFLLWTQGDAWGVAESNRSFFQEQKGVPSPLLITQHAGKSILSDVAAEIFALTRMNWNTGRLYNNLPVTIKSASALGDIAKYMSRISQQPYSYRLFM
jgi:hypothetical protein